MMPFSSVARAQISKYPSLGSFTVAVQRCQSNLFFGFPSVVFCQVAPKSVDTSTAFTVRSPAHEAPRSFSSLVPAAIFVSMPVRSIITSPANGTKIAAGTKELKLRGASWAGDLTVKQVDISIDFGATWTRAKLDKPKNKYDWQRWAASVTLPSDGYYEIWARATDQKGTMQPHQAGFWNPQGYGGNAMHRIAVLVG